MKKTFFLIFTMALTSFAAFAQNETPAPDGKQPRLSADERAKKTVDQMNSVVQLTPDQASKLLEIHKSFFTQREAMGGKGQQMTDDQRKQMGELRRNKDTQVKAVLTPEQWQKWQAAMHEQRGKGMGHGE